MYSKNLIPRIVEGNSLDDVKEELFRKYGTNYEITDYKAVIKPGIFGFHSHEAYRVTYVVNDNQFEDMPRGGGAGQPLSAPRTAGNTGATRPLTASSMQPYASSASPSMGYATRPVPQNSADDDFAARKKSLLDSLGGSDAISTQVKLNDMAKKIDRMASMLDKVSESSSVKDEHETIMRIESLLEDNEFSNSYIEELKDKIRGEFKLEELDDEKLVMAQVIDWIGEDISIAPRFPGKKKPHVIIVVGPTGVGKTTTIAKMAAEIKMAAKDKDRNPVIHMITTDNIRVAAKEQIERYAEVMELNVDKVDSKEDLENLLGVYSGSRSKGDFVFIDTSGFSPNDYEHISKLQEMLDVRNLKADIYLAVSATTKGRDLEKIFKNYEAFGFRSVIVTKCDETSTYGNVLSVLHEKRKSVSLITVGQEVLHKMRRADPVYFLRNLDGFDVDIGHLERKFGKGDSLVPEGFGE
jgi:flagellar biosynthesis protein FlhF